MSNMRPKLKHAMAVLGVSGALVGGGTAAAFALSAPQSSGQVATTNSSSSTPAVVQTVSPVREVASSTTKPSKNCPNMSSRPNSASSSTSSSVT
jgi:hypothetical protein